MQWSQCPSSPTSRKPLVNRPEPHPLPTHRRVSSQQWLGGGGSDIHAEIREARSGTSRAVWQFGTSRAAPCSSYGAGCPVLASGRALRASLQAKHEPYLSRIHVASAFILNWPACWRLDLDVGWRVGRARAANAPAQPELRSTRLIAGSLSKLVFPCPVLQRTGCIRRRPHPVCGRKMLRFVCFRPRAEIWILSPRPVGKRNSPGRLAEQSARPRPGVVQNARTAASARTGRSSDRRRGRCSPCA